MKRRALAAAGVVAVLSLSACSSSPSTPRPNRRQRAHRRRHQASPGLPPRLGYGDRVRTVDDPHHQQAVEMSDMALDPVHEASPDVKKLAKQIKAAQDPEIQEMTGWLEAWAPDRHAQCQW